MRAMVFTLCLCLFVSTVLAGDMETKVENAFAKQRSAFEAMLKRATQGRLTADDRRWITDGGKKPPTIKQSTDKIAEAVAKLDSGEWVGPAPETRLTVINEGYVGLLQNSPLRPFLLTKLRSNAASTECIVTIAEIEPMLGNPYQVGDFKTGKPFQVPAHWPIERDNRFFILRNFPESLTATADGTTFCIREPVVVAGTVRVGTLTCQVVEPLDGWLKRHSKPN